MFKIIYLISVLFIASPFSFAQLNKKIYKSQKLAISVSPFKTATSMLTGISKQKKKRSEFIEIIDSLRLKFPNDTIFLVENYNFICLDCPADFIEIKVGETLITLRRNFPSKGFVRENKQLSQSDLAENSYVIRDILTLRIESSKSDDWNKNPGKFGTDTCFDGGHTFYSLIYPDKKINSMYMRCWRD
ncbi:MAG: hypothetical protein ACK5B9_02920 [Flavobacteriia bacterium]|jgi:hypothetical protein